MDNRATSGQVDQEVESAILESAELAREVVADLKGRLRDGLSTREATQILKALNSAQKNLAALRQAAATQARVALEQEGNRPIPVTLDDILQPKARRPKARK